MSKELDEIFYDAIQANETLSALTGGRIRSTCFEVPPSEEDNTQLPYIVIMDEPYNNDIGTKDNVWESNLDHVQASIEINAASPAEVKEMRRLIRNAIAVYVESMEGEKPYLTSSSNEGVAWDWSKPCYFDTLHYQCDMEINLKTEYDGEVKRN